MSRNVRFTAWIAVRILATSLAVASLACVSCARFADQVAIARGNSFFGRGDAPSAIAEYLRVDEKGFEGVAAYDLANAFVLAGEAEAAVPLLEKATGMSRAAGEAYHNLGVIRYGQGKYEDAAREFRRALEAEPGRIETIRAYEASIAAADSRSASGGAERGAASDLEGQGVEAVFSLARRSSARIFTKGKPAANASPDH